ncbi:hypothetical protein FLL45_15980 [Aliikangiella marina]|uniref:VCBS repeat-containing protein n=1 Tax=Aliikangiella marina TaxID=1712262 RepID=A0A545T6W1_9GAMM|nr:hypothetical protein [Aliikangiella marina]TQV72961.1 hypothetical protein FLL45_15980 [Aliikangiella marina]
MVIRKCLLMVFVAMTLPVLCDFVSAQAENDLDVALKQYFQDRKTHYVAYFKDLNGDGLQDAIVYLSGNEDCTDAGCKLLVLQGEKSGFKFVSETHFVIAPIKLSPEQNQSWRNLVVNTKKIGSVVLKFNGREYTYDSTLVSQPDAGELQESNIIINPK